MKLLALGLLSAMALLFVPGCNGSGLTAPTATVVPMNLTRLVTTPPVLTLTTPAPNPLLSDSRFDHDFYRQFVHGALDHGSEMFPLRRQAEAPRIYLRTVHTNGQPIDAATLDLTAAAMINTAASLTGGFGLSGLEMGTGTRDGEPGWITVRWTDDPEGRYCGIAQVGGSWIDLYPSTPGCRCPGGPAVKLLIVKHELGHALGYRHTDSLNDLMHDSGHQACDMLPSAREIFHARVAYSTSIGSLPP